MDEERQQLLVGKLNLQVTLSTLLIILIIAMCMFALDYQHRKGVANSLVTAIRTDLLIHDYRSSILAIERASGVDFSQVEFISFDGMKDGFTVYHSSPSIFIARLSIPVYYGAIGQSQLFGKVVFKYSILQVGKYVAVSSLLILLVGFIFFFKTKKNLIAQHQESKEREREQLVYAMAKQVAHDIKSPITALQVVLQSPNSNLEAKNSLIKGAIDRIKSIAEDLMKDSTPHKLERTCLRDLLAEAINEKESEFGGKVKILNLVSQTEDLYSKVDRSKFLRILSNIFNNSIESFIGNGVQIEVKAGLQGTGIIISIIDNGSGIPDEVISFAGKRKISIGKSHMASSGYGLGLYDAIKSIQSWGGCVRLRRLGIGSEVSIKLNHDLGGGL